MTDMEQERKTLMGGGSSDRKRPYVTAGLWKGAVAFSMAALLAAQPVIAVATPLAAEGAAQEQPAGDSQEPASEDPQEGSTKQPKAGAEDQQPTGDETPKAKTAEQPASDQQTPSTDKEQVPATTVSNEEDLTSAIASAQDGAVIKLGGNIELTKTLEINKSITLDGANYTISGTVSGDKDHKTSFISVKTDKNFTLQNVTLNPTGYVWSNGFLNLAVAGNTTIQNVVFGNKDAKAGAEERDRPIYNAIEFAQSQTGSATIEGCTFYGASMRHNGINVYNPVKDAEVLIEGNKFVDFDATNSNAVRVSNYSNVPFSMTLDGNEFSAINVSANDPYAAFMLVQQLKSEQTFDHMNLVVKNHKQTGTNNLLYTYSDLSGKVGEVAAPVISGDKSLADLTVNGSSEHQAPAAVAADKDGNQYASLKAAIDSGAIEVSLLADVAVDESIEIKNDLMLKLNGHTVTDNVVAARPFVISADSVNVTVDGTAEGSSIKVGNEGTYGLFLLKAANSTLTVNGGTYSGKTDTGALFKMAESANGSVINLNNVTATTNGVVATSDTMTGKVALNVTGGTFSSDSNEGLTDVATCMFGIDSTDSSSTCTFTNVKATCTRGPVIEASGVRATFEGNTFDVTGDAGWRSSAIGISFNANATIKSGTYSGQYDAYVFSSGGTITVEGGTLTGKKAAVKADTATNYNTPAHVKIEGGKFNGGLQVSQAGDVSATITVTGGTFNSEVSPEYCAEDFTSIKNADGSFTVQPSAEKAEASVGDVRYATVQAAVNAAPTGSTVKVLKDVKLSETLVVSDKKLTLDLNGKQLTGDEGIWTSGKNNWSLVSVRNKGSELTITGNGIVKGLGETKPADTPQAVDVIFGGKLTIESGTFIGGDTAVYAHSGEVVINGGTFEATQKGTGLSPYTYTLNCFDANYKNGTASITVNGGTFKNYDPRFNNAEGKNTQFTAPGVGVDAADDGAFTAKSNMAAQVMGADGGSVAAYGTLKEAVEKAQDGQTVQLLDESSQDVTISKKITVTAASKDFAYTGTMTVTAGATISGLHFKRDTNSIVLKPNIDGAKIMDNTFDVTYNKAVTQANAIYAIDGGVKNLEVTNNTFNAAGDSTVGLNIQNTGVENITLQKNTLNDNYGNATLVNALGKGTTDQPGITGLKVIENNINGTYPKEGFDKTTCGVLIRNTNGTEVSDNTFNKCYISVGSSNWTDDKGQGWPVGKANNTGLSVKKNTFEDCLTGVYFKDELNSGSMKAEDITYGTGQEANGYATDTYSKTAPNAGAMAGYAFAGWYKDASFQEVADEGTKKAYAKWLPADEVYTYQHVGKSLRKYVYTADFQDHKKGDIYPDKTDLRFTDQVKMGSGFELAGWGWRYGAFVGASADKWDKVLSGTADQMKSVNEDGFVKTSLIIGPMTTEQYGKTAYEQFFFWYTTPDGTEATISAPVKQASVNDVTETILSADQEKVAGDKDFAGALQEAFNKLNK